MSVARQAGWRFGLVLAAQILATVFVRAQTADAPARRPLTTAHGVVTFEDVTARTRLQFVAMRWNRSAAAWQAEVIVHNLSAAAIGGPVVVAILDARGTAGPLAPDNPANAPAGEPRFWEVTGVRGEGGLEAGEATRPRTVSLSRLGNQAPVLEARVLAAATRPGVVEPLAFARTLDGDGLPLPSVRVTTLTPAGADATESDPGAGAVSLGGVPGRFVWRFDRTNHWPVWRSATLGEWPVVKLPSPRLTLRGGLVWPASGAPGGVELTNRLRVVPWGGAAPGGARVELTELSAQSLPYPLPLGWSLQRAFWIAGSGPWTNAVRVEARPTDGLPATGARVWLARLETNALAWQVESTGTALGHEWTALAVRTSGAHAWITADDDRAAGAAVVPGQTLTNLSAPLADATGLMAWGRVLPGVATASTQRPEVRARALLTVSNRLGTLPSGSLVRARIGETYRLSDGATRSPLPYEVSVVLRRPFSAGAQSVAEAEFVMQPQILAPAATLDEARIRAEIVPDGAFEGGVVGGGQGGLTREGVSLGWTPNAAAGMRAIEFRMTAIGQSTSDLLAPSLDLNTLAGDAEDLRGVAVFEILTGPPPAGQSLALAFTPPPPDGPYVLARAWYDGAEAGLEPVALWTVANGTVNESAGTESERLPGIDRSGQYWLVGTGSAIGLMQGVVRDPQGGPVAGSRVGIAGSPWKTRTDAAGHYRLAVAAGPANVRYSDPLTGEWLARQVVVPGTSEPVQVDLSTARTAPFVVSVSPADDAQEVSTLAPGVITFNRALARLPAGMAPLMVYDAHSNAVPVRVEWEAGEGALRWIATNELAGGMAFRVVVSGDLTDAAGSRVEGPREFRFTTVTRALLRAPGAQLVSEAPDAAGEAVIRGSPGMGIPRQPVLFVNETSGQTASGLALADGSFSQRLAAAESDQLAVFVVHPDGTRSRYPVGRQLFADGSVALFSEGGRITNRNASLEVVLDVPAGAIQGRTRFKVAPLEKADLAAATLNTPPEHGTLFGGFDVDVEGDPVTGQVRVEVTTDLTGLVPPPGKTVQDMTLFAGAFRQFREWVDGVEREVPVYEYLSLLRRETPASRAPASPTPRPSLLGIGLYALINPSDARVMLVGNVYYSQTELLGVTVSSLFYGGADPVPDSDIPVGGAVIRARAYSALNSRPFTLQGGELVVTSGEDGRFAFLVPEQTSVGLGHALNATHPAFPRQFATSAAGARFDPIHPFGGGKIRFNREGVPDTTPPSISLSHAPASPAAGETALVRVDGVDESGPAVPSLSVESIDPAAVAARLTVRSAGLWELVSPDRAKVVLRARAVDPFGNAGEAVHVVRFGDAPAAPAPANDPAGPRVLYSQPDAGAVGVDPLGRLQLRFSEWVDPDLVSHPSAYFTLSPPAGLVDADFLRDPGEVSLRYSHLEADTEYTLHLGGLRDLTGQLLDQDPTTPAPTNEPFVLKFKTAPNVVGMLSPVSEGGGVVVQGAYAYLIDRIGASVTKFDISIPARPVVSGTRSLPGPPRALVLVRGYANTMTFADPAVPGPLPGPVTTNDFLVVAGALSGSSFGYLRVYDLSKPFPGSPHVASALISMDQTALLTRLTWSAPYLLLTENSAAAPQVHVINLQSLLLGDAYRALERLVLDALPLTYQPGVDANHDGDFVDDGEKLPVQGTDSIEFVAGEEAVLSLAPNYRNSTGIYQLTKTSRFITDAIVDGPASMAVLLTTPGVDELIEATWRPIRTNRLSRPAAVRAFVLGGDSPDTSLPPVVTNGYALEFPGFQPKRALFVPVPLQRLLLVNLISLDLQSNSLRVIDASRPDNLTELTEIPLPVPEYGLLQGAELDPRGRVVLSLARGTAVDLLVLDPRRLLEPMGSSGIHPSILGRLPGAGAGSLPFAVTDHGVTASSLRGVNVISQSAPVLRLLPAGDRTAHAAAILEASTRYETLLALEDAVSLPVHGQGTNAAAGDAPYLWRLLMLAPGGAGRTVSLAAMSSGPDGLPARGTNLSLTSFQDRVSLQRLSDDPLSAAFNAYLSEPLVLVPDAATEATVVRLRGVALPVRAGSRVHAGIPETMASNPVLGPYAGRGAFSPRPAPGAALVRLGAGLARPISVIDARLTLESPAVVRTTIDAVNRLSCPGSAWLHFEHDLDAEITLRLDGRPLAGGTDETGRTIGIFTNVPFAAGSHRILIDAAHLPNPGEYAVEVVASGFRGLDATQTRVATGVVEHEIEMHHAYPIAHTVIQGVDLWDGHLTVSDTDLELSGRRQRLEFRRTYSSAGDASAGPLGAGWTHSYHVRLVHRLDCGTFTVVGGDGSGNAFTAPRADPRLAARYLPLLPVGMGAAELEFFRPQVGYHSVLVRSRAVADRLWFFTKEGIRYEFRSEGALSTPSQTTYLLKEIREPNGNALRFAYVDGESDPTTLDSVTEVDPLGAVPKRGLRLEYDRIAGEPRVVRLSGFNHQGSATLLGFEVRYRYDEWGNLTNSVRMGATASETRAQSYRYTPGRDRHGHNLVETVGPNGAVTRYQYAADRTASAGYYTGASRFLPGAVPSEVVTNVTHLGAARPGHEATADQAFGFRYDPVNSLRWVQEPRRTDSAGNLIPETRYTLNQYGATVRVEAPLGQVSVMRWATDHLDGSVLDADGNPVHDVLMTWRRDAEGQEQFFEFHDGRGNLTRERTVFAGSTKQPVTDAAGSAVGEIERTFAYDATFNQRTNVVDAEGGRTRHEIDPRTGNLMRTIDAEGLATRFVYLPNGDLGERHDPRGAVTRFTRYDPYGRAEVVRDALNNESHTRYDERGRLLENWDAFGHHAEYRYDGLDRRIASAQRNDRAPRVAGPDALESTVYDAAGLVLARTNALGLASFHSYDALNREVRVEMPGIDPGDGSRLTYTNLVTYDAAGYLASETDARGVTRVHSHDAAGRRTRTSVHGPFGGPSRADGLIARLEYDRVGNLTNEWDMHGAGIRHEHDALYRVVASHLPVPGAVIRTRYDREGNQRRVTDAAGMPTDLGYDRIHRLTAATNAAGHVVRYEYDEANNRTLTHDLVTGLETRVRYDAAQREVERTQKGPGLPAAGYTWTTRFRDAANEVEVEDPRGVVAIVRKDGLDRIAEQVADASGLAFVTRMTFDAAGNVLSVSDAQNDDVDVEHTYNRAGRRIRSVFVAVPGDPGPVQESWVHDPAGRVVLSIDRRGIRMRHAYDNLGRPRRSELKEDISFGGGWLVTANMEYEDPARVVTVTDARGARTRSRTDALGRVVRVENALGHVTSHRFGSVDLEETVDGRGMRTTWRYDRLHRPLLVEEFDATGVLRTRTGAAYEDVDRRLISTNRNGVAEIAERDALGRVVRRSRTGAGVAASLGVDPAELGRIEYDGVGNVVMTVDGEGRRLTYQFDALNRVTNAVAGAGSSVAGATRAIYDRVGNLLEIKDARDHGVAFDVRHEYDARYRRVRTVDATGAETTFAYDAADQRIGVTDPRHNTTRFEYDEVGALLSVDESARATPGAGVPDAGVTRYRYDAGRLRVAQQDALGVLVTYAHDVVGRMTNRAQHTLPGTLGADPRRGLALGGGVPLRTAFAYDQTGNLTNVVDARGQVMALQYDHLHRLVGRTFTAHAERSGGMPLPFQPLAITYSLDGNGNPLEATESKQGLGGVTWVERTSMRFDALDRLRNRTRFDHDDPAGRSLAFDYDLSGNRTNLVNADGRVTGYAFDARNRLTHVVMDARSAVPQIASFTWYADGLQETLTLPGGGVSSRVHDAADRLVALTNAHPSAAVPLSAYTLAYDAAGNRTRQTELQSALAAVTFTNSFDFDGMNRLTASRFGAGGALTNTYAANGNRLSERGIDPAGGGVVNRVYHYAQLPARPATTYGSVNALTRIEDLDDPTRSIEYEYDANLNQVARIQGADVKRFQFDARDQMIVADVAGAVTRFDYNEARLRAKKVAPGGGESRYLHDESAVVMEYAGAAGSHAPQHSYEYAGVLLAYATPAGAAMDRQFYLHDPMGSVVHLLEPAGTVQAGYQYDAWGAVRNRHGASSNPRQFTGHYHDSETGLHYFGARYYDDEQARFTSQDPFHGDVGTPPSLHRYLYAHGNPLRFTDPTGLAAESSQEADQWLSEAKAELSAINMQLEADIEAQGADALAKYKAGPAAERELQRMDEEHRRMLQENGLTEADLRNPVMADRAKWGMALLKRDLAKWSGEDGAGRWRGYVAKAGEFAAEVVVSPFQLGAGAGTVAGKLDVGTEVTLGEWVAAAGDVMAAAQAVGTLGKIGVSALSRRAAEGTAAQATRGVVIEEARRTVSAATAGAARQLDDTAARVATDRAASQFTREAAETATQSAARSGAARSSMSSAARSTQDDLAAALRGPAGIQPSGAGRAAGAVGAVEPRTIAFHADFNAAAARAADDTIYIRAVLDHRMVNITEVSGLRSYGFFDTRVPSDIFVRRGLSSERLVNTLFHEAHHLEVFAHNPQRRYAGVEAFMEEFTANIRGIQGEILQNGLVTANKTSIRGIFESQGNVGVARRVYQLYRQDNPQFRFSWAEVGAELQRNGVSLR